MDHCNYIDIFIALLHKTHFITQTVTKEVLLPKLACGMHVTKLHMPYTKQALSVDIVQLDECVHLVCPCCLPASPCVCELASVPAVS